MIIKTIFNSKSSNNINKDDNKPASLKFIKAAFKTKLDRIKASDFIFTNINSP